MNKSKKTMKKMLNLVQEYDNSFLDEQEEKKVLTSTIHPSSYINSSTDNYTKSVDYNN